MDSSQILRSTSMSWSSGPSRTSYADNDPSRVVLEAHYEETQASGRRHRLNSYVMSLRGRPVAGLRDTSKEDTQWSWFPRIEKLCKRVVTSQTFQILNLLATLLAILLIALQLDVPQHHSLWRSLDIVCLCIFLSEILAQILAFGPDFAKDRINLVDVGLVGIQIVDLLNVLILVFGEGTAMTPILRSLRVIRGLRLFKVMPQLQSVSQSISRSLLSVMWGLVLLCLALYLGGILFTLAFRNANEDYPGFSDNEEDWPPLQDFNPQMYFGSVTDSMYTLFNLLLLTEFSDFARAIWMRQPILVVCLAAFACCCFFGAQSFIISQSVERVAASRRLVEEGTSDLVEGRKLEKVQELCNIFFSKDTRGSEVLTLPQLREALREKEVWELLEYLELPVHLGAEELFHLLDCYGDGEVPHSELARNAVRLVASSTRPFEAYCLMQLTMNRLITRMSNLEQQIRLGMLVADMRRPLLPDPSTPQAADQALPASGTGSSPLTSPAAANQSQIDLLQTLDKLKESTRMERARAGPGTPLTPQAQALLQEGRSRKQRERENDQGWRYTLTSDSGLQQDLAEIPTGSSNNPQLSKLSSTRSTRPSLWPSVSWAALRSSVSRAGLSFTGRSNARDKLRSSHAIPNVGEQAGIKQTSLSRWPSSDAFVASLSDEPVVDPVRTMAAPSRGS